MLLAFGVTTLVVGRRDLFLAKFDLWGVPFHAEWSVELGGRHVYMVALCSDSEFHLPMAADQRSESMFFLDIRMYYGINWPDGLESCSISLVNSCADLSWVCR
jgi:hypothetical protein